MGDGNRIQPTLELEQLSGGGCQFGSDTEKLLVFKVLNGRYEVLRPTLVISNLDLAGMKHYLDVRTIDRLTESGSMAVVFDWESYRQIGQAKRYAPPSPEWKKGREVPTAGYKRKSVVEEAHDTRNGIEPLPPGIKLVEAKQ